MAKVKIFLEEDETLQEAEDSLFKALNHHNSGDVHGESFQDPAMVSVANKLEDLHSKMYHSMLQDIFEALDQDFSQNGY